MPESDIYRPSPNSLATSLLSRSRLRAYIDGLLHPWRHVTGALGGGAVAGILKRAASRRLYEYLARRYPQAEWSTMNYGYACSHGAAPPDGISPADPERLALQLYWRVATSGSRRLAGLDVLEIGSGRGGGAAFIARSLTPRRLLALDFSHAATVLARQRYASQPNLEYRQGDAEALALADASFDVVLNVESAHCYGSIPRFLTEVHRVLRPGGELLFADFVSRRNGALARLERVLRTGPLRLVAWDDISSNVVRALDLDEARKRDLIDRWATPLFRSFARGAYAMEGTAMRDEFRAGRTMYVATVLRKDAP
jgi:SAM-dependent methyltransferase